jgi:predicted dehydrogenase
MNRRDFIRTGATAGLALSAAGHHVAAAEKTHRVGLIGCGWYGKEDLTRLIQVGGPIEVIALCDVDKMMLDDAADRFARQQSSHKRPQTYGDYRKMLKESGLDICLIGTPDHWHALAMIAAVEAGCDVYCQKPISVDVAEGKAMLAAARKNKRVVQVGTQRRSTPHLIEARDRVINEGKLGKIGHVEVCCYYHMRANGNPDVITPPDYLDYEMWTGPAPLRPYDAPPNPHYNGRRVPHRRWWRTFTEYGNGIMGDMCIHMLDMVRWMLGLGWPKTIESAGGILVDKKGKSNISDTQAATFDFGDLQVTWQHRTWGNAPDPDYDWAAFFYGDKGTLKASVKSYDFIPAGQKRATLSGKALVESDKYPEDPTNPDPEPLVAAANRRHQQDFLKAIASRGKPVADIEQGYMSTASCLLANLSMKLGRSFAWDAEKQLVVNDDEANKLLARPYRGPWVHPEA